MHAIDTQDWTTMFFGENQGTEFINSDYLLRLARDKSIAGRSELAATISDIFLSNTKSLSDRERALSHNILSQVIRDVEMSVRQNVSEQLARLPYAPRDLVLMLANDDVEVAYPILAFNKVLQDADLIELIRHRTLEHQLAIAIREDVSEAVSDALVQTGKERVVRTLLDNPDAAISSSTMEFLVEQSQRVDGFHEPILNRGDLDPALAQRMFMWVSAALRQYILDTCEIEPDMVDDLLEAAAIEGFAKPAGSSDKARELVARLAADDAVTPEMLVALLQEGETLLFLTMFQRLTGLRERLVKRLVFEPGGEGLAIACKSAGLGKAIFSSIFTLTRKARPSAETSLRREIRHVLNLYDRMTEDSARLVVRRWQRNVSYLAAIRELEIDTVGHG
ncbi:MAG: DUF2336 domain-containing protein [Chloroflexi bacterium]|nr:DUF2336 domain-containing protein [Chloroflexota bacterium]